jgi:hypothetical protein
MNKQKRQTSFEKPSAFVCGPLLYSSIKELLFVARRRENLWGQICPGCQETSESNVASHVYQLFLPFHAPVQLISQKNTDDDTHKGQEVFPPRFRVH